MKLYLMLIVFLLLSSLIHSYEVKGIRLGRSVLSAISASSSNIQEIIKISSSIEGTNNNNQDDDEDDMLITKGDDEIVLIPTATTSGINRKLCMTKTTSPTPTTTISKNDKKDENKNDSKTEIKSAEGPVSYKDNFLPDEPSLYPSNIDITEMDYTPARKKSPIHN